MAHNTSKFLNSDYAIEDKDRFVAYVENQLKKIDVETTEEEKEYMRNMIYTMYSNPLKNKLSLQ